MSIVYNLLLMIGSAIGLPYILLSLIRPKRRAAFRHRLGWTIAGLVERTAVSRPIWIHALSVGEVISAEPLVDSLRDAFPQLRLVFSASTQTGMTTARRLFDGKVEAIFYFPYDLYPAVRRVVNHVQPQLVVIVETDLWPNFLFYLRHRSIPIVLVNARLSLGSFRGYRLLGAFSRNMVQSFGRIGAQSVEDARRFTALGAPPGKVEVTGNLKFDQKENPAPQAHDLRSTLGLESTRLVVLLGSTHEGEEAAGLQAFLELKPKFKELMLVVAPRDPGRAAGVERQFRGRGLKVSLLPALEFDPTYRGCDVLIVNTIGILRRLYAVADIVFVGGSLVSEGGHNPLEPASVAKPILFGADMSDFAEVAEQLTAGGGAMRLRTRRELALVLGMLLSDPARRTAMGRQALRVFVSNKGSVEKTMALLRRCLAQES